MKKITKTFAALLIAFAAAISTTTTASASNIASTRSNVAKTKNTEYAVSLVKPKKVSYSSSTLSRSRTNIDAILNGTTSCTISLAFDNGKGRKLPGIREDFTKDISKIPDYILELFDKF